MGKAVRAVIIQDGKTLIMYRNKHGSEYCTLVGGRVGDNETAEQALIREVKEETGLDITKARLVFIEEHPAPYNEQYIFLCEASSYESVAVQPYSEEGFMNRISINTHKPGWVDIGAFPRIHFRTPQLQNALIDAFKKGFPDKPIKL
ncbi:MAG TPA: NUDIX hydrolase [Candidatus Saccharimonadales bacterium]|nr:NUDIX hydrolase [Candidatus Saccharimonadales bacterium]